MPLRPLRVPTGIAAGSREQRLLALKDYQEGIQEKIEHSVAILRQAIRFLEEEASDASESAAPKSTRATLKRNLSKVFVVHGHDESALQGVARFLEQLGLEAIILREQPDQGRTIIEKFEDCAGEVGFQGNRVKFSRRDEACQEVVVPSGGN